jgi:hypothetical protein
MAATWSSLNRREKTLRAHTLFWWALVFPLVAIVLGYTALSKTLHAQAILADHSIVQATVAIDTETQPTENLARFKYSFMVDGKTYSQNYPVLKYRAEDVQVGSTIPVAYANFDPNQSQREAVLMSNADMSASLTSLLTMFAIAAVLIGLIWLVLSALIRIATVSRK